MTISFVDLATSGFYSVRSNYARENIFKDVREIPVEGAFEGTFVFEVEATKSIKHISKNSPKSSNIPDYTRRDHVLHDVK